MGESIVSGMVAAVAAFFDRNIDWTSFRRYGEPQTGAYMCDGFVPFDKTLEHFRLSWMFWANRLASGSKIAVGFALTQPKVSPRAACALGVCRTTRISSLPAWIPTCSL